MSIERRVAKLEENERVGRDPNRQPGVSAEMMEQIRKVAGTVASPAELEAYLSTLRSSQPSDVVTLEDRRRNEAARKIFARAIFDEVRS